MDAMTRLSACSSFASVASAVLMPLLLVATLHIKGGRCDVRKKLLYLAVWHLYFTFNPMLSPARGVRPGHSPRPPVPRVRRVNVPVRAPQLRAVPTGQERGVQRPLPIDCHPTGERERCRSWNKGIFLKRKFYVEK